MTTTVTPSGRRASPISHLALLCLVSCLALASCESGPRPTLLDGWQYEDLFGMDPADAEDPNRDLIAIYQRLQERDLEIRLDYLDLEALPAHDLILYFDTGELSEPAPGEATPAENLNDLVLIFPADGGNRALGPDAQTWADLVPRIIRHQDLDAAVISLNLDAVPELAREFRVMAVVTGPGETEPVDELGPVASDAPPPVQAPLLLAFWNTFPAYTPAQALRQWQGAHTGPFGGRHGLRTLIDSAEKYQTPVVLLDLKNPKSLSALDYLGQMDTIRGLAGDGLLELPDSIPISSQAGGGQLAFLPPSDALQMGARLTRESAQSAALPASQALYAPLLPDAVPSRYGLVLLPPAYGPIEAGSGEVADQAMKSALFRQEGRNYLPLPDPGESLQADADGLGLAARLTLVEAAFAPDSWSQGGAGMVVLGGDLFSSSWGDPQMGEAAFRYISAHPWIRVLTLGELREHAPRQAIGLEAGDFPPAPPALDDPVPNTAAGQPQLSGLTVSEMQESFLDRLAASPEKLQSVGWDSYFTLLAPSPPEDERLPALRQGYLGQLGALLAVGAWEADPADISDCSSDPDLDGAPECILASDDLFLLFEDEGARLTHAFARVDGELVQWIGPFSQFINGLSDPSEWQPELGPAGDPGDVPGAFSDAGDRWSPYTSVASPGRLAFVSPDGLRQKNYQLTPAGLMVRYDFGSGVQVEAQIPLALAPDSRFLPGWSERYQAAVSPGEFVWSIEGGPRILVRTSGDLSAEWFLSDEAQLVFPEDPNYDYPPGHLIPFPFALVEVTGEGEIEIEITVSD